MNRYTLLGTQFDTAGQEWAYVFDSQTGETFKSAVRAAQTIATSVFVPPPNAMPPLSTGAQSFTPPIIPKVERDPAGEVETPEQRIARLGTKKVPPAFLGNTAKMGMDPGKTGGVTDVMPNQ